MKMVDNRKKKKRAVTILFLAAFLSLAGVAALCDHYYISHQKTEQQKLKDEEATEEAKKEIIFINDTGIPGEKDKCKEEFTAYLQEGYPEVKMACVLENATRITDDHYLFTIQVDVGNQLFDCIYNATDLAYEFNPRSSEVFNIDKLGGAAKGESLLEKYSEEAGLDAPFKIIGLSNEAEAFITEPESFKDRLEEWVTIEYPKEKIRKAKFKEIVDVSQNKPDSNCICFQLDNKEKTEIYVYISRKDGNILIAKKDNVLTLQKEK